MKHTNIGKMVSLTLRIAQFALLVFIAIYAFAGWSFADNLITLKSVVLVVLIGAVLQRLAAMIPGQSRYRPRPDRLILASL